MQSQSPYLGEAEEAGHGQNSSLCGEEQRCGHQWKPAVLPQAVGATSPLGFPERAWLQSLGLQDCERRLCFFSLFFFKCFIYLFTYYWRHCEAFEILVPFSSVQFSHSVTSNSLQLHEMQHARLPCPSPTPGACSNSCTSSQWCHPTISSSVIPFASCLQSFPASGSFSMS